jgi:hypothetical protein
MTRAANTARVTFSGNGIPAALNTMFVELQAFEPVTGGSNDAWRRE